MPLRILLTLRWFGERGQPGTGVGELLAVWLVPAVHRSWPRPRTRRGTKEIDFIARDGADITYYQVAETIAGDEVRAREFTPLNTVRDHHPKLIRTLDAVPPSNDGGIRTLNALDFLLGRI